MPAVGWHPTSSHKGFSACGKCPASLRHGALGQWSSGGMAEAGRPPELWPHCHHILISKASPQIWGEGGGEKDSPLARRPTDHLWLRVTYPCVQGATSL